MKYTYICVTDNCEYVHDISYNFSPKFSNDKCPLCENKMEVINTNNVLNQSANLVSGVGDITSRLPSDFKDFMQGIKNGSKGCTMRDFN